MFEHLISQWIFKRYFALPDNYAEAGPSLQQLSPRFQYLKIVEVLLVLVGVPLLAAAVWYLLRPLAAWNARRFEPSVLHLYGGSMALVPPAVALAFAGMGPILLGLFRLILRRDYPDYVRYRNLEQGYDGERMLWPLVLTFGGLSAIVLIAILDWHAVFYQDKATFESWFGFSASTYNYTEITQLRTAPSCRAPVGRLINRREYEITFRDGQAWRTSSIVAVGTRPEEKKKLFDLLSARSGVPIQEVPVLE